MYAFCSCKIFVMTMQSDYESTSFFSPFQYLLLSLSKEDKEAIKMSCSCRIYEKADLSFAGSVAYKGSVP